MSYGTFKIKGVVPLNFLDESQNDKTALQVAQQAVERLLWQKLEKHQSSTAEKSKHL